MYEDTHTDNQEQLRSSLDKINTENAYFKPTNKKPGISQPRLWVRDHM